MRSERSGFSRDLSLFGLKPASPELALADGSEGDDRRAECLCQASLKNATLAPAPASPLLQHCGMTANTPTNIELARITENLRGQVQIIAFRRVGRQKPSETVV